MTLFELILLAISLAMDCFTVSITSGIILKRVHLRTFLTMAFFFGLFQAMMPLIGWFGAAQFSHLIEAYDHWIAFGLLAFLGGRMIVQSFGGEEDNHFDPTLFTTILTLSVATSIDALAVGVSFAFSGITTWGEIALPILLIGLASFILSLVGSFIGVFFGLRIHFRIEWVAGLVLIAIGVRILIEHGAIQW
jgi:putative Mn2+ efflux pump MntP